MIEAGISSSDHIATFFGLNDVPTEAPANTIKQQFPFFENTIRRLFMAFTR
jgi:hypothetical protein